MTRTTLVGAALVAAMMPTPALAQDRIVIDMIGVRLEAPLPAGYCLPDVATQAIDDLVAAADTLNVTHVALRPCDAMLSDEEPLKDYYLIKSPRAGLAASVSREAFLAEMAQHFGKAEWQVGGARVKEITDKTNRDIRETLSPSLAVEGDFGARGTDADCAYLGGEAIVSLGTSRYPIQGGACMTSVGNKVLTVYLYGEPTENGVVALMQKSRDLAMAFKASPPPTTFPAKP